MPLVLFGLVVLPAFTPVLGLVPVPVVAGGKVFAGMEFMPPVTPVLPLAPVAPEVPLVPEVLDAPSFMLPLVLLVLLPVSPAVPLAPVWVVLWLALWCLAVLDFFAALLFLTDGWAWVVVSALAPLSVVEVWAWADITPHRAAATAELTRAFNNWLVCMAISWIVVGWYVPGWQTVHKYLTQQYQWHAD